MKQDPREQHRSRRLQRSRPQITALIHEKCHGVFSPLQNNIYLSIFFNDPQSITC